MFNHLKSILTLILGVVLFFCIVAACEAWEKQLTIVFVLLCSVVGFGAFYWLIHDFFKRIKEDHV